MAAELYPVGGSASAGVPADVGRAFCFVMALEQLIAADNLRIAAVFDLHPGRIAVLRRVPAVTVLGDDTLQVALADQLEKPLTIAFDVVHVEHAITGSGNYPTQGALALDERRVCREHGIIRALERPDVNDADVRRS